MGLPPRTSTLMDIRRPSGAVVAPADTWAGEQDWYSDSDKPKHQLGLSTSSMGALSVAEKRDFTSVLSFRFVSSETPIAREVPPRSADGTSAYAMPVRFPSANSNVRRFDPSRLAL